jgi:hypothetical protein
MSYIETPAARRYATMLVGGLIAVALIAFFPFLTGGGRFRSLYAGWITPASFIALAMSALIGASMFNKEREHELLEPIVNRRVFLDIVYRREMFAHAWLVILSFTSIGLTVFLVDLLRFTFRQGFYNAPAYFIQNFLAIGFSLFMTSLSFVFVMWICAVVAMGTDIRAMGRGCGFILFVFAAVIVFGLLTNSGGLTRNLSGIITFFANTLLLQLFILLGVYVVGLDRFRRRVFLAANR